MTGKEQNKTPKFTTDGKPQMSPVVDLVAEVLIEAEKIRQSDQQTDVDAKEESAVNCRRA